MERDGDAVPACGDSVPRGVGAHRVGVLVRRARQPSLFCGVRSLCGMVVRGDDHLLGNGRHARSRRRLHDRRVREYGSLHSLAVSLSLVGIGVSTRRRSRRGGFHRNHTRRGRNISVATVRVVGDCRHTLTHTRTCPQKPP